MGGSSSKEDKEVNQEISQPDASFHIIHLHAPTLGFGLVAIVVIIVVLVCFYCYKRRNSDSRRIAQLSNQATSTNNLGPPPSPGLIREPIAPPHLPQIPSFYQIPRLAPPQTFMTIPEANITEQPFNVQVDARTLRSIFRRLDSRVPIENKSKERDKSDSNDPW